ncbi:MAG: diacylglycerol kinase family protein [Myxococcota bacterium]
MTVAVVTNPKSRHNRRNPGLTTTLAYVLGERGEVVTPSDVGALGSIAARFRERGVDTLCVNGGDGTLHQVLTAFVRTWGEDAPLPQVCVLRGGTMNIVADSVGVKLGAEAMLGRLVEAIHTGVALPTTTRRLMRFDVDDLPPLYGFLAGNGIIARFLELYYDHPDPSPLSAASLLARGAASALVQGPLIKQLMRPYTGQVSVDGVPLDGDTWTAVALGTVAEMGLGFRVFPGVEAAPDALQVVAIGSSVASLAAELPSVYRGRGVHRPGNRTVAGAAVALDSPEPIPLMIDGDFCRSDQGRVRVRLGPPVTFVTPG